MYVASHSFGGGEQGNFVVGQWNLGGKIFSGAAAYVTMHVVK